MKRWIERRLTERLGSREQGSGFEARDAFVQRYEPTRASNLDFHVDDEFVYGDAIVGVSLESDTVLTFVPRGVTEESLPIVVRVPLPARSALVLRGAARRVWQHGILAADVVARRTSITLRTAGPGLAGPGASGG